MKDNDWFFDKFDRLDKLVIAVWLFSFLFGLAFLGAVIFVAIHFLAMVW